MIVDRSFVNYGMSAEAPPCGTVCFIDCDLGPNLDLDTNADVAEPSPSYTEPAQMNKPP